jgi:hypothetical protein
MKVGDTTHIYGNCRRFLVPGGAFAFASGPRSRARLLTPGFVLHAPTNLMFAYYKASRDTGFRVSMKKVDSPTEQLVFQAPVVNRDSRRWFREARTLDAGQYEYVSRRRVGCYFRWLNGFDCCSSHHLYICRLHSKHRICVQTHLRASTRSVYWTSMDIRCVDNSALV